MQIRKFVFLLPVIFTVALAVSAQTKPKTAAPVFSAQTKSSPAFAEVILRKTELLSDLEALLVTYTEDFPKVKELRYEIDALDREFTQIAAVKAAESSKLTLALGKLMVRKAELETDYWALQKKYGNDHPDVKRAKRKVEIYENSIKEILS